MPWWIEDQWKLAMREARNAEEMGEVPVGAVITDADGMLSRADSISRFQSTTDGACRRLFAMREAAKATGNYRLAGLTLYCTMEPCVMCAGAMVHARIKRLVYGAADARAGASGSIYNILADTRLNHQVEVVAGVMEEECRAIVQKFFEKKSGRSNPKNV